jgi:WD40 repeat protein
MLPAERSNATGTAAFGHDLRLLTVPNLESFAWFNPAELSSSGSFYAAVVFVYPPSGTAAYWVHFWNLRDISLTGHPQIIEPSQSLEFEFDSFKLGGEPDPRVAFSPDEKYLALKTWDEILVFNIPEFTLHQSLPVGPRSQDSDPGVLVWSADSSVIGISSGKQFTVWNIYTNQTYEQSFERTIDLERFGDEWLLWSFSEEAIDEIFAVCPLLLESCTEYHYPGLLVSADPNRHLILIQQPDMPGESPTIGIWRRAENGIYQLDEETLSSHPFRNPTKFSPSGEYVFAEDAKWTPGIWNINTLELVHPLEDSILDPMWLGTDDLFVVQQNSPFELTLYELQNRSPLDVLDVRTIEEFGDIERYVSDPAYVSFDNSSHDGHKIAFGLGGAVIIIPVEFE